MSSVNGTSLSANCTYMYGGKILDFAPYLNYLSCTSTLCAKARDQAQLAVPVGY
jgi:hypothetical protein